VSDFQVCPYISLENGLQEQSGQGGGEGAWSAGALLAFFLKPPGRQGGRQSGIKSNNGEAFTGGDFFFKMNCLARGTSFFFL